MPIPFWRRSNVPANVVIMITNAHRDSLSLKLERIELAPYFERLISSHDYGFPKENPQFWDALQADIGFDPARSLFIDDTLADSAQCAGFLVWRICWR